VISVITTTYNCAEYLECAIKSILNQTFKEFEYIIINDGSTDNTDEIIEKCTDSRIRYFKLFHIGRSASLNYAIQQARHKIIALQDADDIAHLKRLEREVSVYDDKVNTIVFTDSAFFTNNKILFLIKNTESNSKYQFALHGHFNNSSFFFNKKYILENGGYNESLESFEDYDLWLRIFNKSEIKFVNEVLIYSRIRKNSLSSSDKHMTKTIIYNLQKRYYENLSKSFTINSGVEQLILKGWREFFYGTKSLSRKYWFEAGLREWNIKLAVSFLLSFLPERLLNFIKDKRLRLRLEYETKRLMKGNEIQKEFKTLLRRIDE